MADNQVRSKIAVDTTEARASITTLNREIRVLESSFKATSSSMGDWTKTAAGNEARINTLNGVIELQKQKVDNLAAEYDKVVAEQGESSKAAQDLQIKLNNQRATLGKYQAELRTCEERLEEYGDNTGDAAEGTAEFEESTEEAEESSNDMADAVQRMSNIMSVEFAGKALKLAADAFGKLVGLIRDGVGAIYDFSSGVGQFADDTMTMSQQTGISAETLQEWAYASQFVDTEVEAITGSMSRMIRMVGDASTGSATAQESFSRLGVSLYDASGVMRDSEDIFWDAVEALGEIESETERDAMAMDLFGRSAQELNPLIEAGREAFELLGLEAHDMGLILSDSALEMAGAFNDTQNRFQSVVGGLKNSIGLIAIPLLNDFLTIVTDTTGEINGILADGLQAGDGEQIGEAIISGFEELSAWLQSDDVQVIMDAVGDLASGLVDTLVDYIASGEAVDNLVGGIESLLNALFAEDNLTKIVTSLTSGLVDLVGVAIENLPEIIVSLWNGILNGILGDMDNEFANWARENLIIDPDRIITDTPYDAATAPYFYVENGVVRNAFDEGYVPGATSTPTEFIPAPQGGDILAALAEIEAAGAGVTDGVAAGIEGNMQTLTKAGEDIVDTIAQAISNRLPKLMGSGYTGPTNTLSGLAGELAGFNNRYTYGMGGFKR